MVRSLRYPVLALLLVCALALGQSPSRAGYKGGFLVSGQAGASMIFHKEATDAMNTELSLNFAPRVLYFLMDGLGAGLEASASYFADGYKTTGVAVGPRIAYYLVQTNTKYPRACCLTPYFGPGWWMPFAGLSVLYLTNRDDYGGTISTSNGWLARIGAGMSPLIGDRGTMPIEVGYEMQSVKYGASPAQSRSRVYLEVGFGAFLFK
ncbi:MAG: hypothetical protein NTX53_22010 [candidate division WOR-3 bacterium]|nr:hypothetical protein [candidate division WOR-3 bacterium]